jgi:hypothetical protein
LGEGIEGEGNPLVAIQLPLPVALEDRLETAKAVLAPHDLTRLSERSRQALQFARDEARVCRHAAIGVAHLLVGLMRERNSFAAHALRGLGIALDQARDATTAQIASDAVQPRAIARCRQPARAYAGC